MRILFGTGIKPVLWVVRRMILSRYPCQKGARQFRVLTKKTAAGDTPSKRRSLTLIQTYRCDGVPSSTVMGPDRLAGIGRGWVSLRGRMRRPGSGHHRKRPIAGPACRNAGKSQKEDSARFYCIIRCHRFGRCQCTARLVNPGAERRDCIALNGVPKRFAKVRWADADG